MRKLALPLAAVMAFGAVGVAQAVDPVQGLNVDLSATKAKKKLTKTVLDVTTTTAPKQGEAPFAVQRAVIHFDKGLVFTPKKFPGCSLAKVESGKCSSKARVGTGHAKAIAGGANGLPVNEIKVTAYNGTNGKTVYLLVSEKMFNINKALIGTLKSDSGKFGKKLDVKIPTTLQNVAGLTITLTEFNARINKTLKGVPFVGLASCSDKSLDFKGDFFYSDGTTKSATHSVKCS